MLGYRLKEKPSLDTLRIETLDKPSPGEGEVLMKVGASSLNFHDYLVVAGHIPVKTGLIPMSDGAGEIVEVGEGVDKKMVGQKGIGSFFPRWLSGPPRLETNVAVSGETIDGFAAEYVVIPANSVTPVPAGFDYAQAATLPCAGLTSWRALVVEGQLKAGDTVLVMGTGGLSLFTIQLAKTLGINTIVISSSDEKLAYAKSLGATHLINYKKVPEWSVEVKKITNGRGVELIMEVGGASTMTQSQASACIGGKILLIGTTGNTPPEINFSHAVMKHLRIDGMAVGSIEHQLAYTQHVEATGITPIIDRSFTFDCLADAFRYQLEQNHLGKIVVTY